MTQPILNKPLLLLACSARKRDLPEAEALQLYDGVCYRVLAGAARRQPGLLDHIQIVIISARYGYLHPRTDITPYDLLMTKGRALELAPSVQQMVGDHIRLFKPREIFVCLGQVYRLALGTALEGVAAPVTYVSGGIGRQQQQLKRWLEIIR